MERYGRYPPDDGIALVVTVHHPHLVMAWLFCKQNTESGADSVTTQRNALVNSKPCLKYLPANPFAFSVPKVTIVEARAGGCW